jgi:hypothetical protein
MDICQVGTDASFSKANPKVAAASFSLMHQTLCTIKRLAGAPVFGRILGFACPKNANSRIPNSRRFLSGQGIRSFFLTLYRITEPLL